MALSSVGCGQNANLLLRLTLELSNGAGGALGGGCSPCGCGSGNFNDGWAGGGMGALDGSSGCGDRIANGISGWGSPNSGCCCGCNKNNGMAQDKGDGPTVEYTGAKKGNKKEKGTPEKIKVSGAGSAEETAKLIQSIRDGAKEGKKS